MRNYELQSIEDMLCDFITSNNIATMQEIELVTCIVGYSEHTLNEILYTRTGYHNYEQAVCDYEGTVELNDYYNIIH